MSQKRQRSRRRLLGWAWIYFLHFTGVLDWACRRIAKSGGVVVLTLHRVLDASDLFLANSPAGMMVSSSTFKSLLEYLNAHHSVLSLAGNAPSWSCTSPTPRVAITFDDGWKDTAVIAHPLAKIHGLSFAVFVCPGLVGRPSPFWPEQVISAWHAASRNSESSRQFAETCRQYSLHGSFTPESGRQSLLEDLLASLKAISPTVRLEIVDALSRVKRRDDVSVEVSPLEATMTWEEILRIYKEGVVIGSHSQHHEILTAIPLEAAGQELANSKSDIENKLNGPCALFAYPNGSWSPKVKEKVAEHGYSLAFTNSPGIWTAKTDPWLIPRVNLWEQSVLGIFGSFSPAVFKYTVFWRSFRASESLF